MKEDVAARGVDLPGAAGNARDFVRHQTVEERYMRKQRFNVDALMVSVHAGIQNGGRQITRASGAMVACVTALGKWRARRLGRCRRPVGASGTRSRYNVSLCARHCGFANREGFSGRPLRWIVRGCGWG